MTIQWVVYQCDQGHQWETMAGADASDPRCPLGHEPVTERHVDAADRPTLSLVSAARVADPVTGRVDREVTTSLPSFDPGPTNSSPRQRHTRGMRAQPSSPSYLASHGTTRDGAGLEWAFQHDYDVATAIEGSR